MTHRAKPDIDARILRALSHPDRQQMLTALAECPASATTLARSSGLAIEAVRDHLACLVQNDAVEPVDGTDTAADDRRYRAMIRPFLDDAHWRALPADSRQALFDMTLGDIATRVAEARGAGGFGHVQTHVSLSRLLLDERGWQEITDLLAGVLEEAMEVEAECAARHARGDSSELVGTNLAILHFGRAERHERP